MNDLIKYGSVQRGFLGAMFLDASVMNSDQKKANNVPESVDGIYITNLVENGGAKEAGIKVGDVIKKIKGISVQTGSELQEQLSNFKPGDKVKVTYDRNGSENTVVVTLKNSAGNFDIVKPSTMLDKLGAEMETLDPKKAKELGLNGGVVVKKINDGVLNDQTRMRDGLIITKLNGKDVKNMDDLRKLIGSQTSITISGVYPGYNEPFDYPLSLDNTPE